MTANSMLTKRQGNEKDYCDSNTYDHYSIVIISHIEYEDIVEWTKEHSKKNDDTLRQLR